MDLLYNRFGTSGACSLRSKDNDRNITRGLKFLLRTGKVIHRRQYKDHVTCKMHIIMVKEDRRKHGDIVEAGAEEKITS